MPEADEDRRDRCYRYLSCFTCCYWLTVVVILIFRSIFWIIFLIIVRPHTVKFHVSDASLTEFKYTNNTLHYNLPLNFTIRTPNTIIGVYFDFIEARTQLLTRFDWWAPLEAPFYQGHRKTTVLSLVFKDQLEMALGVDDASKLDKEKSKGVYEFQVKLCLKVRYKLGAFKGGRSYDDTVTCDLQVPLTSNSLNNNGVISVDAFRSTKCNNGISMGS